MENTNNYTNYSGLKKILSGLFVFFILASLIYYFIFNNTNNTNNTNNDVVQTINLSDIIDIKSSLYSTSTTIEGKINLISKLKSVSLDESVDKQIRVLSGQAVTANFFDFGMTLYSGFSTSSINQREIYEYAKYINTLGDSNRNSLLTAYMALRYYPKEVDEAFISGLLNNYNRYVSKSQDTNPCFGISKFGSVIYLSTKNNLLGISKEFGNYYSYFDKAVNNLCVNEDHKLITKFMWLAALSDIGNTEQENQKSKELVNDLINSNSNFFVSYLNNTYFSKEKEPDTVSIVNRLISKYPEFKKYIEYINSNK